MRPGSELIDFLENQMHMQEIYQPALIIALLDSEGHQASYPQLAESVATHSSLEMADLERRLRGTPTAVLTKHRVISVDPDSDGVSLNFDLTEEEATSARDLADLKLSEWKSSRSGVWWVNQGKSYKAESTGGYMWAPLKDAGGARRSYHRALEKLSVGDVVVSYSGGAIRALIEIDDETVVAQHPDPDDERDGYLSRCVYWELKDPISLAEIPADIRIPESGPFMRNGDPILGYLFALSPEATERIRSEFRDRWPPNSPWADMAALEAAALHLLLKWSPEREQRTVDIHRTIAEQKGSVWWGKSGARNRAALSPKNIKAFRAQIEAGIPTHVFLYKSGEVWRTDLLGITDDESEIQRELLPGYYEPDECELFVRLTAFDQLPDGWAESNLVVASNPDPQRTAAALAGRSSLLMVHVTDGVLEPTSAPSGGNADLNLLSEQTLWPKEHLQELITSLTEGGQIVLAGPPGTSKTWVARHLASFLTDERLIETVQFHPSYGYEEFMEGLRPTTNDHGGISFVIRPGLVRRMAGQAQDDDRLRILVMDEMNRANLPRVFGELMFLFEYRDQAISLQYTSGFSLPKNLLFIGAMNTADRSIRSIDVALRRRFDIFDCPPSAEILQRYYTRKGATNEVSNLIDGFQNLNADLEAELDRHHKIGHAFFMPKNSVMTRSHLERVWRLKIGPLIEEYFFDRPERAAKFTFESYWP